jgi:hypothetical protein
MYEEIEIVGVTANKDCAVAMAADHSRVWESDRFGRARYYELEEWELGANEPTSTDYVYAKNGEIIKETYTRTDVSAQVEAAQ